MNKSREELFEQAITEHGNKITRRILEILGDDPKKQAIFIAIVQEPLQNTISDMRAHFGSEETEKILELMIVVNKEIDATFKRFFAH